MKRFFFIVLKKLPIILAVLVAPATLMLVLHFRPDLLEFLKLPVSEEKQTEKSLGLEVDTGTDWEREAALCATADDFNDLAEKAWKAGRDALSEEYSKHALVLDPQNERAREALGFIRFIPEEHLDRFNDLLPFVRDDEIKTYTSLQGTWLNPDERQALTRRWNELRVLLADRRSRREALAESLGAAAWSALENHDLLGQIVATWDYRIERSRPPFVFILRGEEPPGPDPASAFLDTLAGDLTRMLEVFRSRWLPAPAGAGDEDDFGTFHVVVLDTARTAAIPATRLSEERAHEGAVSFLDKATGLLVTSLPEDRILYSGSASSRREMVAPFGSAIVAQLCDRKAPFWLVEGIAALLPMGRGVDAAGALRLNGEGIVNSRAFTEWIAAGIDSSAGEPATIPWPQPPWPLPPWPLPLDTLLGIGRAADLRARCAAGSPFQGAIEACALFCHHLARKKGAEFTNRFAAPCLSGKDPALSLEELLADGSTVSIEQAMIERYISERARRDLAAALRERVGAPADEPGREGAGSGPAESRIPYLSDGELYDLVDPAMTAGLFRAIAVRAVRRHGFCRAEELLREKLGQQPADSAVREEWSSLQLSARFLSDKFFLLGKARFEHRLGGVDAVLVDIDSRGLLWEPARPGQDLSTLPDGCRARADRTPSGFSIVTPETLLPLEFAVSRFKKVLGAEDDEDRLAYARLFLHAVDGTRFVSELESVSRNAAARNGLERLFPLYTNALAGADLFTVLTGERPGTAREVIEFLTKRMRKIRESGVLKVLDKKRIGEIVKGILDRTFVDGDRYLWDTFEGFEGTESGRARFAYDFTDRGERDDFDFRNSPLQDLLRNRLGAGTVLAPRSFQIKKDNLSAYGSDFVRLRPHFNGEIAISISLGFSAKREKNLDEPYHVYFGWTTEDGGDYIASACLDGIDLDGTLTGASAADHGQLACPPDLAVGQTHTAILSLAGGKVALDFGSARIETPLESGPPAGQVFVWVHGPRWFHIDLLEVEAALDPVWLESQIAPLVEAEFGKIMN